MITSGPSTNRSLRQLWWLGPACLFALVIGSTMLAAAVQSDAAFRLYGAPKFITMNHVLLSGAIIFSFAIGRRLAAVTGRVPGCTPPAADSAALICFWGATALTLLGYGVWLAIGVKNGFTLGTLRELLTIDDPLQAESIRKEMFVSVKGVTTCTQFAVAAVPLGLWLFFHGRRRLIWPLGLLFLMAAARALVFSERLALIELAVPAIIVTLRMQVLSRALRPAWQWGLRLAPLLGVMFLVAFFGSFEYFRSWRHYQHEFNSYAEFTLWRFSGYYTTAHNNSAMALETQRPFPIPYATLAQFWSIPGLSKSSFGYPQLAGFDPLERHLKMLEQIGTPELNNEGGLFQPALDFGIAGMLLFWMGSGFVAGRIYRAYQVGTLAGVTLYPLVFLAILETPRFLYLCYPRSLPALVTLLFVAWLSSRTASTEPARASLVATV